MGILLLMLLIIGLCSYFISRVVYKSQVKNNYKSPMAATVIVFILVFAILSAVIFFLIINNIMISR